MREPLTADQFQAWKAQPATRRVLQYLRDYRESLKEEWAEGRVKPEALEECQAKCQVLKDLAELDFSTIEQFYTSEEATA